jgi:hypothetical protein
VESILKLLHDFDCADLAKFREKLPHFPMPWAPQTSAEWGCSSYQVQIHEGILAC